MARLTQDQVVAGLVQRGVPAHVAQGVALNFRDESNFDTGIQEQAPTSGRGGYGLAQWTGPRRKNLENFAASRNRLPDDPDTQLDFFMAENSGPEAGAWAKVLASPDASSAAATFVNEWERPAAQHAASRTAAYQGVGGAGVAPASADGAQPPASPIASADMLAALNARKQPDNWMTTLGDAMANTKMYATPAHSMPKMPAEAARVDAPDVAPMIAGADPNRRAQFAQLLANLNSGRLYG